jgi:hypothetical protein
MRFRRWRQKPARSGDRLIDDARKGSNESEFRELNERLEDQAARRAEGKGSFEIVCECDKEECTARIRISFADYEAVRESPSAFIVLTGHADLTCERIVTTVPGYEVVEKFGPAGMVAEHEDPREASN